MFIVDHILFSFTISLAWYLIRKIALLNNKSLLLKNSKTYIVPIAIYFYICFISGTSVSIGRLFVALSPIAIINDQTVQSGPFINSNFQYPFWKSVGIRLWHDLPLRNVSFPSFHYFLRADYYYAGNPSQEKLPDLHCSKNIVCVLKNLGKKPLALISIKNIVLRRDSNVIPDKDFGKITIIRNGKTEIYEGLIQILNFINNEIKFKNHPIILYPLEEILLFDISPAITNESISIETEIEYYEFPRRERLLTYYQYDIAQFINTSDRIISAKQKLSQTK